MFAEAVLVTFVCGIHFGAGDFAPVIETINFPRNFSLINNAACRSDVDLLIQSLDKNVLWAYRMWEASAKMPLGLTEGSQYQLGNFDECLSIKEPFVTQYCLTTINIEVQVNKTVQDPFDLEYKPYLNLYEKLDYMNDPNKIPRNKIFWGFCVPASCDPEDIKIELQNYLNHEHNMNIKQYKVELNYNDCQNDQKGYNYVMTDFLFCVVTGFFIIITGICTLYSLKYYNDNIKKNKSIKLLLCFSAKEHFHDLVKPEGSNKAFRIFYGTKFFLMVSLIFGHSLDNMMTGSVLNFNEIEQINRSFIFMPVCIGDVVVDIFFFISGILNTYSYLVQSEKKSFSAVRSIILRYSRLVPVFAIITFFYSTLFYKLGSGPLWPKIIGTERNYCLQNWWTNLLLVNNYINVDNMCILQGWYLGVDFQLFLLSIPLNYLIKKNSKFCWTIVSMVLCGSIVIPFLIVYIGKKEPIFYAFNNFFFHIRQTDNFQSIYIPGHTRMSTYILGMVLGFGYYKLRDSDLKLSFVSSSIVFSAASIVASACIFSGVIFYNPYLPYDALKAALYAALHRPAFATASGVMLFVLSFGSIPQHMLTCSPMIPLSKLSFTAFLAHFVFQLSKAGSQRTPTNFSMYYWFCQGVLDVALSFAVAFVLFIFIENPCAKFMKEILPTKCFNKSIRTESTEVVVQ